RRAAAPRRGGPGARRAGGRGEQPDVPAPPAPERGRRRAAQRDPPRAQRRGLVRGGAARLPPRLHQGLPRPDDPPPFLTLFAGAYVLALSYGFVPGPLRPAPRRVPACSAPAAA